MIWLFPGSVWQKLTGYDIHDFGVLGAKILIASLCITLTMGEDINDLKTVSPQTTLQTAPLDQATSPKITPSSENGGDNAYSDALDSLNEHELFQPDTGGQEFVKYPDLILSSGEIVRVTATWSYDQNGSLKEKKFRYPLKAEMKILRPTSGTYVADPLTGDTTIPLDPFAMKLPRPPNYFPLNPVPEPFSGHKLPLVRNYADEIVERANAAERRRADQSGTLSGLAAAMRRMEQATQVTEEITDDAFDDYDGPGESSGPDYCSIC